MSRPSDGLYAEVIHVPCPTCGADSGQPCVRGGKTARTPCLKRIKAACPQAERHAPEPDGYLAWHEWAEQMSRTHKQTRCEGCGRWAIWVPKTDKALSGDLSPSTPEVDR